MHPLVYLSFYPKINIRRLNLMAGYFLNLNHIIEATDIELIEIGLTKDIASDFNTWKINNPPEKIYHILAQEKIYTAIIGEQNYPNLLMEIPDPPAVLFFRGTLTSDYEPAISIVGSRKISPYGKISGEKIISPLAESGICIVSGLALGLDTLAHELAVKNNCPTLAVLGGGVDKNTIYPKANYYLAEKIIYQSGAIISEYPPFFKPAPYTFPARNRIIAGLTKATLVIEAPQSSGALITANCALDYNREVLTIPHPINNLLGAGCNHLIKKGAIVITEVEDIYQVLNINLKTNKIQKTTQINAIEQEILAIIHTEPQHIDEIIEKSRKNHHETTAIISLLEIKGLIKNNGSMRYYK